MIYMTNMQSIDYKKLMFLIIVLGVSSCGLNDDKYYQNIMGTWDVYKATLNGKTTGLMKDAYFIFSDDKTVISNVFEGNQKLLFVVKNSKLQIEANTPFEMNISRLDVDTMFLDGKMSYYQMEYFLVKRK
jgi:hypothetical protein